MNEFRTAATDRSLVHPRVGLRDLSLRRKPYAVLPRALLRFDRIDIGAARPHPLEGDRLDRAEPGDLRLQPLQLLVDRRPWTQHSLIRFAGLQVSDHLANCGLAAPGWYLVLEPFGKRRLFIGNPLGCGLVQSRGPQIRAIL